ncbi:MAG: threonine synthase [Acidimicrobiales bacterium]
MNAVSYRSTRGGAPDVDFATALITGLAPDGGLYCPVDIPRLPSLDGATGYADIARRVMWPYVEGSVDADDFAKIVDEAYRRFRHPEVCPVIELGSGHHLLDLTQGPTLAFKDVALQLVGRLLDHELARRDERVVVVGATSGDTGSAAIEALANLGRVTVVMLHPAGRVSDIQRRQMTTVDAPNVHNLAVEGSFDDCQDLVKASFASDRIGGRHRLTAVNSINWARVMAQIVYYVTAARAVAPDGAPVSFAVPTGNFGNILSGWYAKRMGLAVDRLVVATNRNDVLYRYLTTGDLVAEDVVPTLSPSMDIQISSNFERMLWEASGRDSTAVVDLLTRFRTDGRVHVPDDWTAAIRAELVAARLDDDGILGEVARTHDRIDRIVDPHTAVGLHAAQRFGPGGPEARPGEAPMITLATADPAKFPDAVERAIGIRPALPPFLAELPERRERYETTGRDLDALADWFDTTLAPDHGRAW